MSLRLPLVAAMSALFSLGSSLGCAVASDELDPSDGGKKKDTGYVLEDDTGDDDTSSSTAAPATTAATTVIEVDADGGTPGTQTVALGTSVSFHIVSATDQEFHLHGYDIEDEGTDVTMTFVADQAGTFDLESHATDTLLFTLVVAG